MPKKLNEKILDKLLITILKNKDSKIIDKLKNDPDFKSDIELLHTIAKKLEDRDEKIIKKINAKYKGTKWEKYF